MVTKNGRYWHYKFRHGGVGHRGTTGCTSRRKAEGVERQKRLDVEEGRGCGCRNCTEGAPQGQGVDLATLEALDILRIEDDGKGKARRDNRPDRTKTIKGFWTPLRRVMRDGDVSTLTIRDVETYVGKRRNKDDVKGQTIRREVQALVRGLRIAKRDKLIAALPFDPGELPTIKSDPKKKAQKGKVWPLDQVEAMFSCLTQKALIAGHLDRMRLILLTGLRLKELHRVEQSWVTRTLDGVPILAVPDDGSKTSDPRIIPLSPVALEIIERCVPFKEKKPNKSLKLASERAGLNGVVTPRDLRKTYLNLANYISGDAVATQRLGGHTNIATTGLYLEGDTKRAIDAGLDAATRIGQKWSQQGGPSGPGRSAEIDPKDLH